MSVVVGGGHGFDLERSADGVTMVVTGPWSREAERVLESGAADGLDLNYAKGFKDTDLAFIKPWPLRDMKILARTVRDLAPLYRLSPTLESLSVQTDASATIDLSQFPALTRLSASWSQVRDSIGELPGLRDLFLLGYTETDLEPLCGNRQLDRLRFKDHPRLRSLDGLGALPSMRRLGVYLAAGLSDIRAIQDLSPSRLVELHLEACPLGDLEPVASARSLRTLNASDCREIESLRPIRDLVMLEALWLYGTTRILDGDLSPIAGLPRLRELRMQSRRTYSPSLDQIKATIAEQNS